MSLDKILSQHVGEMGCFQWRSVLLVSFQELFVTAAVLAPVFVAATPNFKCIYPIGEHNNTHHNETSQCRVNIRNDSTMYDHTSVIIPHNASNSVPCEKWEYDTSVYQSTIVTEWDLVCDGSWLVATASSIFMVGKSISSLIFGFIADRYGRRPAVLIGGLTTMVFSVLCSVAPNITVFLILRFLVALFAIGKHNTAIILAAEFVGNSWRAIAMNVMFISWCIGFVYMATVSYFIRHWRQYMLVTTLPELLFYLLFYFLVPESPRWLLTRDRLPQAEKVMAKMAAVNRSEYPEGSLIMEEKTDMIDQPERTKRIVKTLTLLDLFKSRQLCLLTLNLLLNWFAEAFIYFGLSLHATNFGANPFLSFAFSGLVEVPAYLIAPLVAKYLGRIPPFSVSLIVGGIVMLIAGFVSSGPSLPVLVLTLLGKFLTTISFSMAWTYSTEVYPTCVRNIGVTTVSIGGRIGSVISPYIFMLSSVSSSLPFIIFAVPTLIAGVLVLFLPETRGHPLTQTLEEGEHFVRKNKMKFCRRGEVEHVDTTTCCQPTAINDEDSSESTESNNPC